jgi:hypothetical protein
LGKSRRSGFGVQIRHRFGGFGLVGYDHAPILPFFRDEILSFCRVGVKNKSRPAFSKDALMVHAADAFGQVVFR